MLKLRIFKKFEFYYIHYKLIEKIKRAYKYKLKNIGIYVISCFQFCINIKYKKIKTYPLTDNSHQYNFSLC